MNSKKIALVIHGGAATILKSKMTPEMEKEIRDALTASLQAGFSVLSSGESSLNDALSAIKVMEDSPLFNAGKGAVFSAEGTNEMDASIMSGENLKAGAVAEVQCIKNPIEAALKVLQNSQHVLLTGKGAEQFAKEQGCEIVDPAYFWTEFRWKQWQKLAKTNITSLDHITEKGISDLNEKKFGTVGAIALDLNGNLAAGTSTGGLINKNFGRIGDSPIIGSWDIRE